MPIQEMPERVVRSLGGEDPLEEDRATHSSILAWRGQGQRSLAGYSPEGHKASDISEVTAQALLVMSGVTLWR